jgi:transposase-like protein
VTTRLTNCRIVFVGKRRDGGSRYWCIEHKANATAKYGRRARFCRYAHLPQLSPSEILKLDVQRYPGGVALWGAVPPVYDTTSLPIQRGVHVHAREATESDVKNTDETYRSVSLFRGKDSHVADISELDAIYYMVSTVFGFKMKYVECSLCGLPHLDKDWFSVHNHRRHLCAGCGKQFRDHEKGIGNPSIKIQEVFPAKHKIRRAEKTINFKQEEYAGGIQIWGSNPALLWTSKKNEEAGIHIHAFGVNGSEPELDDTYSSVVIDGIRLNTLMVRRFMAQSALPHIEGRVISLKCPQCGLSHFDKGEAAFTPHTVHVCHGCGLEFKSNRRVRKTVANPIIEVFERLSHNAIRSPRCHSSNLLPETL